MKKGDLVKQRICLKAIELFGTYGYYQTSFQLIADALELKQTNILYHFKDKHKLFMGVLEIILVSNYTMVAQAIRPEMNAEERLFTHMQMNLEWALKHKEMAKVILLLYYFATYDKVFEAIYQKVLNGGRQRVLELILAGVREGYYQNQNAESHSEILHDMLLASVIPLVSRTGKVTRKEKNGIFDKWKKYLQLISIEK